MIKMKKQLFIMFLFGTAATFAQTTNSKIGSNPYTINPSAILELESVSKGLLLPRLTTAQRDAIVAPAEGLIIYNSTTKQLETNKGTSAAPVWSGADVPDATSTIKGKLKLAGDLSGTADLPTVPGLSTKEPIISAGTVSQYWRGDKSWQTLDKAVVGLNNVDNTSDLNKPISTATQTALNAKEDLANKSTSIATDAASTTKYPSVKVIKDYVDAQVSAATIPDATTTIKGKLKLAGDLSGTSDLPTVPGLATKEPTITAGTVSQYWRGDKTWQTLNKSVVGLANVDNTSDLNKPISTATQTALNAKEDLANKSTSIATDAASTTKYPSVKVIKDYVDAQVSAATIPDATDTVKGKLQLAGDLSGTATAPSVVKLQGNSVSATAPTSGQLLAWNATTSAWEPGAPAVLPNVAAKLQIVTTTTATIADDVFVVVYKGTDGGTLTPPTAYPGKIIWVKNESPTGFPVNFSSFFIVNGAKGRMFFYDGTNWLMMNP
jgi:hypothetical protein